MTKKKGAADFKKISFGIGPAMNERHEKTAKKTEKTEIEQYKSTSFLVKPSIALDFRINCKRKGLKVQDELEKMLIAFNKKHG